MGLKGRDIALILVKCLRQCLAHSNCSVTVSSYYVIGQQSAHSNSFTPLLPPLMHPCAASPRVFPALFAGFATSVLHPAESRGMFLNKKSAW